MNDLLIIGAGGHGKVVFDAAKKSNKFNNIYFVDDRVKKGTTILSSKVICNFSNISKYKEDYSFFVAIGDNKTRKHYVEFLISNNYKLVTVIHPDAILGENVIVGIGSVLLAGTIVNSDTTIGIGCILNTSSSIDHDCKISDFVHVSPNVCITGNVVIGQSTWVGASATVLNNLEIGSECIIGASALVRKNVEDKIVGVGIPFERLK